MTEKVAEWLLNVRPIKNMRCQGSRPAVEPIIQVVSTGEEFVKLRPEWDRILRGAPHSTVFSVLGMGLLEQVIPKGWQARHYCRRCEA